MFDFKCCIAVLLTLLAEFFGALLNFTPSPPLRPAPVDAPPGRLLAGVSGLPEHPRARCGGPCQARRQPLVVLEAPLARGLTGSEPRRRTVGGGGEDAACVLLGPPCGLKPVSSLLLDFLSFGKGNGEGRNRSFPWSDVLLILLGRRVTVWLLKSLTSSDFSIQFPVAKEKAKLQDFGFGTFKHYMQTFLRM